MASLKLAVKKYCNVFNRFHFQRQFSGCDHLEKPVPIPLAVTGQYLAVDSGDFLFPDLR